MLKSSTQLQDEIRLTVYFDDPFWAGVFERVENGMLSVCKVTFGAEPSDAEISEFITKYFNHLNFSRPVMTQVRKTADNPKRRQRNAKKQIQSAGIGTKSQQALKKQQEENKLERKQRSKAEREAEKQRLFEMKKQKRKDKHKGH